VAEALDAYVNEGILSKRAVIECSVDQTTAYAEDVKTARARGDEYPCPGPCERDLTADLEAREYDEYTPEHELPTAR
jgi:hypothetical protein